MTPTLQFIISSLAAYRITRLLVTDSILDSPRNFAFRHLPSILQQLIQCSWCTGVWVSAALTAIVDHYRSVPLPGFYFLAVATIVGIISHYTDD